VRHSRNTPDWLGALSPGAWVIAALALLGSIGVLAMRPPEPAGLEMWIFSRMHKLIYDPAVAEWNAGHDDPVTLRLLSREALERRMLGGFLGDVPTADLFEVERDNAPKVFGGPLDAVGFVDLTDLVREEGLLEKINAPSFGAWSSRGRIFGLPHDVHPVMLAVRADLVERYGVDLDAIETWEDFEREFRKVQADENGDGEPDRYAISFWLSYEHLGQFELLLLQAGGGCFDADGRVRIDCDENAMVLAELVRWMTGDTRIAADTPEWNAGANQLKVQGYVAAILMPDWLCNYYRNEIPALSGKLELIPLPSWTPGGRHTSVWGGSMLGIARATKRFDDAWAFAKHLYFSDELARRLYTTGDIITPIKSHWDDPIFDEPDPYFGGQPKGRLYIDQAPDVPRRVASPFNRFALTTVQTALVRLRHYAVREGTTDREVLRAEAHRLLAEAERTVRQRVDRNVFVAEGER